MYEQSPSHLKAVLPQRDQSRMTKEEGQQASCEGVVSGEVDWTSSFSFSCSLSCSFYFSFSCSFFFLLTLLLIILLLLFLPYWFFLCFSLFLFFLSWWKWLQHTAKLFHSASTSYLLRFNELKQAPTSPIINGFGSKSIPPLGCWQFLDLHGSVYQTVLLGLPFVDPQPNRCSKLPAKEQGPFNEPKEIFGTWRGSKDEEADGQWSTMCQ